MATTLGALVLLVSIAGAGTPTWTLPATAGWEDITAHAVKVPGLDEYRTSITDDGGTFEATAFAAASGTMVMVIAIDQPSMPVAMSFLEAYEAAERDNAKRTGPELAYTTEIAPSYWSVTQRIGGAKPTTTRRFEGFLHSGGLRSVAITCYAEPAACDPVLASATFPTTPLRELAHLDESPRKPVSYWIGFVLTPFLLVLLVVALARKFRRRASK